MTDYAQAADCFEQAQRLGDTGSDLRKLTSEALRKHAETLGPQCDLEHKDLCSPEQLTQLEKYAAMSQARRDAKMIKLKNAIKKLETSHEALQKRLSAEFEASKSSLEALQEKYKPELKMLKAATPSS